MPGSEGMPSIVYVFPAPVYTDNRAASRCVALNPEQFELMRSRLKGACVRQVTTWQMLQLPAFKV